jgi:hypothetical protein
MPFPDLFHNCIGAHVRSVLCLRILPRSSKAWLLDIFLILVKSVSFLLLSRPGHQEVYCKYFMQLLWVLCWHILSFAVDLCNFSLSLVLMLYTEELNMN